jgi:hypothetical protein
MAAMRSTAVVLLVLAGCLTGCPGDDDDSGPCPAEDDVDCAGSHDVPIEFEVGTGDPTGSTFTALPDDGVASLYPGPQGGYHVYLQVRARGLCPNRVVYERTLREPGQTEVIRNQVQKVPLVDGGDGSWVLPRSEPTFVCPSLTPGVATAGRDLDLEVTLTEELKSCDQLAGLTDAPRSLTQHVTIHPTCAPSDTVCQQSTDVGCAAP